MHFSRIELRVTPKQARKIMIEMQKGIPHCREPKLCAQEHFKE